MPYRPVIGIPYDPRTANPAFFQHIDRLKELQFNTLLFDCRYDNEEQLNGLIKENLKLIDGLLMAGSPEDIPPKLYGEAITNPTAKVATEDRLTLYQMKMIEEAKKRGLPILGICAGSNVLNITYGGKINQDITQDQSVKVSHDIDPRDGTLAHEVTVKKGSHLFDILMGKASINAEVDLLMQVNSWHHTANTKISDVLAISAAAEDGIVEGIEEKYPGHPNCWGIQFHPEFLKESVNSLEYQRQLRIFNAFRTSCIQYHHKTDTHHYLLTQFDTIKLKKIAPQQKDAIEVFASASADKKVFVLK